MKSKTSLSSLSFPLKRLAVVILSGAAWFDEHGFDSNLGKPVARDLCGYLGAVVGPDVLR
jgi:hypothetical protein